MDIGQINAMLNSSDKRLRGLAALADLLTNCSVDVIVEQHSTWETLLMQILLSHDDLLRKQTAIHILTVIVCRIAPHSEFNRHLLSAVIPSIMSLANETSTNLISSFDWSFSILDCLLKIIPSFHGSLSSYSNRIESLAVSFLQLKGNFDASQKGAELLALLPACYSGNKRTEVWCNIVEKVLGSLCNFVNEACDTLGMEKRMETKVCLGLPQGENGFWDTTVLANHLRTVSHCWKHLFNVQYYVLANVCIDKFMRSIGILLGITPKLVLLKVTEERLLLLSLLPILHSSCCDMLNTLSARLGGYLITYDNLVSRWLMQLLTVWSHDHLPKQVDHRTIYSIRPCVYVAIETWVCSVNGSTFVDVHADNVIKHIIADIESTLSKSSDVVSSKSNEPDEEIGQPPKKKPKKRASEYVTTWSSSNLLSVPQIIKENEKTLCLPVLHALNKIVLSKGLLLQPKQLSLLVECVINVARYLVNFNWTYDSTVYLQSECRAVIFENLITMITISHPSSVSYLSEVTRLLVRGLQDPSKLVADVCKQGMLYVANIIHPRAPPISTHASSQPFQSASSQPFQSTSSTGHVSSQLFNKITSNVTSQQFNLGEANMSDQQVTPVSIFKPVTNNSFIISSSSGSNASSLLTENSLRKPIVPTASPCEPEQLNSVVFASSIDQEVENVCDNNENKHLNNVFRLSTDATANCLDSSTSVTMKSSIFVSSVVNEVEKINSKSAAASEQPCSSSSIVNLENLNQKRKLSDTENTVILKSVEETEENVSKELADMLNTFVDASPDSDDELTPIFKN